MNSCRILIVEDEAIVAMDIEARLAAMGYQLAGRAESGRKAMALAEEMRPELILMDIRLKGPMDGIAAALEIRKRFHLPVIFLTAYSEDATLDRAKLAEPYGYILKPFDDRELKSAIEIALYKHRAEEEIRRLTRLYDVLSQVNQAVVRIKSKEELLSAVCRIVVERGNVDLAWIGWMDPKTFKISLAASFGKQDENLNQAEFYANGHKAGQSNPGQAIRQGKPFICNACVSPDCANLSVCMPVRLGFQSCGSFPIRLEGRVHGALSICAGEAGFFREREIALLEEVAMDVSFALDKIEEEARRKQAEAALRESEERLRIFIEHAPASLAMFDRNMRYLSVSRRWLADYRPKDRDLIGLSHYDVFPDIPEHWKIAHRRALDGEVVRAESDRLQWAGGSVKWLRWEARPWRDQTGEIAGIVIFSEDITERKQLEEDRARVEVQLRQAQKMEALGTLAGGIAHDFNNILAIIIGFTELIISGPKGNLKVVPELQQVLKAAYRAKDLVQQILAFSRMSEPEKIPVQAGPIVKEAMKMLRASLPVTIDFKVNIDSTALVLGDASQIHQVIMNLCTNAGCAMRDHGGELSVNLVDASLEPESIPLHSGLKPGPYVLLSVKDTGHGIAAADLERIFDPFFTTKKKGEGTGLGLSVVHGIVKRHGGAIEVESLPGKGASFQVYLPAVETAQAMAPVDAAALPYGQERILLVEDEPALATAMKQMLERLGYRVDERTSSVDALSTFLSHGEDNSYDLVISDMTMPRLTGLDFARELLKLRPGLPILLCTGFSEKINAGEAKQLGIKGVLMKPVTIRELAVTVRTVLDEKAN
jgi:PAS domain S-box-containing protein